MRRRAVLAVLAVSLPLLAQEAARPVELLSVGQHEPAIRAARQAFNEAIAARQFDRFGEFLMPDAETIGSNGTVLHGVEAYAAAIRSRAEDPDFVTYVRSPEEVTVGAVVGLASESGIWRGTWRGNEETVVSGRYLAQWRRTADGWRLHAELYVGLDCHGPRCESVGMTRRE